MPARKTTALTVNISKVQNSSNAIGDRGEKIFELAITDYQQFGSPLFKPSFLGEKWPKVDFYVELLGVPETSPFFFAQVKATTKLLSGRTTTLKINIEKQKCEDLFRIPGPTYIVGVHEPKNKAYILSIHAQPDHGVYRIPLKYELTPDNLRLLYKEVQEFWKSFPHKPTESNFK